MEESEIVKHWVWVIDVVYGAIIGMGYAKLDDAIRDASRVSWVEVAKHILCATGFLSFVVYYVCAYHLLIVKYPYAITPLSGFRYALDLMLLFLAMVILSRSLASKAEESTLTILIALTAWHVGAAIWHLAASLEYYNKFPQPRAFVAHFYFIILYWFICGVCVWYAIVKRKMNKTATAIINTRGLLYFVSLAVFIVAIVRYYQLITMFGE